MHLSTDGLVIKEQNIGESDRLITVLTRSNGVIKAFVRGAKTMKSKMLSSTQLLSYSDFVFYKGKDAYTVDNAQSKNVFFDLRSDIDSLSIAFYLSELAGELAPENDDSEDLLRLLLNSLYLLNGQKRDRRLIKAVAELRAMSDSGYMPDLVACSKCGEYESPIMYFNKQNGSLLCQNCYDNERLMPLSLSTVTAMRYIIYSEDKKIFDFTLNEPALLELCQITEAFVLEQTGRGYKTLDFYKSLGN